MMLPSDYEYRIITDGLVTNTSGSHSNNSSLQGLQNALDYSTSQSVNTIASIRPEIISDDLIAGQRPNGTMSNVRRFFCLFVTFDLLFISLMWVICIMLNGGNLVDTLKEQIVHYEVHKSLFDVVLAAICRFTVLLLFYALLYVNHWIIISLSTSVTCIFLICKVFVYDWTLSQQPVFEVLLILASFILSWSEAWFLDFRVLPQEQIANRYLVTAESERTPLLRNYIQSLHDPSTTESIGNFYSPLQSPEGSLRAEERPETHLQYAKTEDEYLKIKATHQLSESWKLLNDPNWKMIRQSQKGDTIDMIKNEGKVKTCRLTGVVSCSPKLLLDELFYRIENMPEWNETIIENKKMHTIDEYTDVTYQLSTNTTAGVSTSRDFLNLRRWAIIDGCYIIAFSSVKHPDVVERKGITRGENRIGSCFVMRPISEEANKCVFQWVLHTDLEKCWIPKYVIDNALMAIMFEFLGSLRDYVVRLQQSDIKDTYLKQCQPHRSFKRDSNANIISVKNEQSTRNNKHSKNFHNLFNYGSNKNPNFDGSKKFDLTYENDDSTDDAPGPDETHFNQKTNHLVKCRKRK